MHSTEDSDYRSAVSLYGRGRMYLITYAFDERKAMVMQPIDISRLHTHAQNTLCGRPRFSSHALKLEHYVGSLSRRARIRAGAATTSFQDCRGSKIFPSFPLSSLRLYNPAEVPGCICANLVSRPGRSWGS
jgi:hypothetical protein